MNAQIISFNCTLKNKAGRLISSTFNKDIFNAPLGDAGELPALAEAMQNLKVGEMRSISLSAEQAYGLYDPQKVILFPRSELPEKITTGTTVLIREKTGTVTSYKILSIADDFAKLDGNHELAGQDLIFEIEALAVRAATPKEVEDASHVDIDIRLH